MLPVSEQYVNSLCEMKFMDGTLILLGYIKEITEEGLEIRGREDRLPVVHCNTIVKISLFNSILGFRVLIGKVYLSTEDMIRVVELQSAADFEKRNFFRVKVSLPCSVQPVVEKEKSVSFSGSVNDISLGGLFFACGEELNEGDNLIVRLKLYDTDISLLCKIIRKKSGPDFDSHNGYGCEFLDNTGRQFDLICKYLFDCQREQIRIIKQMQT